MKVPPSLVVVSKVSYRSFVLESSTMKWSDRTAQGFSAGLGRALNRPESGGRKGAFVDWRVSSTGRAIIGCHFQGIPFCIPNLRLKPWAVLSSHFMAKSSIERCCHARLSATNA